MNRISSGFALVGLLTLLAACDDDGDGRDDGGTDGGNTPVQQSLQDLGGSDLLQAFNADANAAPVDAQSISISPQPRAEPFDVN